VEKSFVLIFNPQISCCIYAGQGVTLPPGLGLRPGSTSPLSKWLHHRLVLNVFIFSAYAKYRLVVYIYLSRLQSAPCADNHNSSPGSASQRWIGHEHGGPRVVHEDRGCEATECEPHRDPDRGTAAHVLGSTKMRRTESGKMMIRSTNGGGT
jgi:hypothetical protein